MVRTLLIRGMLVGVLAGLLAFGFARVFGEPQINLAIAFEEHVRQIAGEAPEPELVSREIQSTVGLLTGAVAYGAALGGIFALVFAYAHGRIGRLSPRVTSALLAAAGFFAIILAPQLKYPANPPSIGNPETLGLRTALYFTMIVLSVIASVAALGVGRRFASRLGDWNAALIGAAVYIVLVSIAMLALPPINEAPADYSADVLWKFRVASLGIQLVLWTTLGLVFGALADRLFAVGSRNGSPKRFAKSA
jgi:hypothetical protein